MKYTKYGIKCATPDVERGTWNIGYRIEKKKKYEGREVWDIEHEVQSTEHVTWNVCISANKSRIV